MKQVNLICLIDSGYDAELEKRGKTAFHALIKSFTLEGLFNKVIVVYNFREKAREIIIDDNCKIIEIRRRFDFLKKIKLSAVQKILNLFIDILKIKKIMKAENIHIIRGQGPMYRSFMGAILKYLTGRPFSVSIHTDFELYNELKQTEEYTMLNSKLLTKKVRQFIFDSADLVLPISGYLAEYAKKRYKVPDNKIRIIYHGVKIDKFDDDVENRAEFYNNIIFVGRLDNENLVIDCVDVAYFINKKGIDFKFRIIGSGPAESELRNYIIEKGLEDKVLLLGRKNNNEVLEEMKSAKLIFCPMSGFVLIEAGLMALPVVAYDIEWHKELIKNKETGMLIPFRNKQAVAEAAIWLIENYSQAIDMGKKLKARTYAQHNYIKTQQDKKTAYMEKFPNLFKE